MEKQPKKFTTVFLNTFYDSYHKYSNDTLAKKFKIPINTVVKVSVLMRENGVNLPKKRVINDYVSQRVAVENWAHKRNGA